MGYCRTFCTDVKAASSTLPESPTAARQRWSAVTRAGSWPSWTRSTEAWSGGETVDGPEHARRLAVAADTKTPASIRDAMPMRRRVGNHGCHTEARQSAASRAPKTGGRCRPPTVTQVHDHDSSGYAAGRPSRIAVNDVIPPTIAATKHRRGLSGAVAVEGNAVASLLSRWAPMRRAK